MSEEIFLTLNFWSLIKEMLNSVSIFVNQGIMSNFQAQLSFKNGQELLDMQ